MDKNELIYRLGARDVVLVLDELHKMGYENLWLFSGMSPSGGSWRWMFVPKEYVEYYGRFDVNSSFYSQHSGDYPCSSASSTTENANIEETARAIVEYFPAIINTKGCNSEYMRWFAGIVELAKNGEGDYPVFYDDYYICKEGYIKTMRGKEIIMPPYAIKA